MRGTFVKAMSERAPPLLEKKARVRPLPGKVVFALCVASFFIGLIFRGRVPVWPSTAHTGSKVIMLPREDCNQQSKRVSFLYQLHNMKIKYCFYNQCNLANFSCMHHIILDRCLEKAVMQRIS